MKPGKPSLAEALGGGVPDDEEDMPEDDGDDTSGGQALLDAIDAKDAGGVVAAFNALYDMRASKDA